MTLRHFWKYSGAGNDFIIVWKGEGDASATAADAIRLCSRKGGVSGGGVTGADGILEISEPSGAVQGADARMRILNSDGSEAEMCGNGLRCAAAFLQARNPVRYGRCGDMRIGVETAAGYREARNLPAEGPFNIEAWMGVPDLTAAAVPLSLKDGSLTFIQKPLDVPMPDGTVRRVTGTAVSMGNPHFVLVDPPELTDEDFTVLAPLLETHPLFPRKTNVELVRAIPPDKWEHSSTVPEFRMTVWERGCGWTKACGTGACAAAVAIGLAYPELPSDVVLRLPGGDLRVEAPRRRKGEGFAPIRLYGPAQMDFEGELELGA